VAQETVSSAESRTSKNNLRPSAIESLVGGLSAGIATGGSPKGASIGTTVPTTLAGDVHAARITKNGTIAKNREKWGQSTLSQGAVFAPRG
jgi:hypothetical protein